MGRFWAACFYAIAPSACAVAQPLSRPLLQPRIAVNGVVNAASNAPVGWPNSSIAQGSIFSIYGGNLGPASSPALEYPLAATLGGVSVEVTSGGGAWNAIPIFVSPGQINAILPDSTPAGAATVTITYDNQTSNPASFQVAAHSFGIFTVNSTSFSQGSAVGIITGAGNRLYSVTSPANPGDAATVWGTGIGASPGDDGSGPPQQIDMPNLAMSVYVGNQPANVLYRGRSTFSGEDQIDFTIPPGITGCYIPVAVLIGNVVSNFVTMPIAPGGQSCPDAAMPNASSSTGAVELTRIVAIGDKTSTKDFGLAFFGNPQFLGNLPLHPIPYIPFLMQVSLPAGTCVGGLILPSIFSILSGGPLDAGPDITITGPNGSEDLTRTPLFYTDQPPGRAGAHMPLYLGPGAYTVSAPGGSEADPVENVGPFSHSFTMPQPLAWTNAGAIASVDRSAGVEVTWTGGDPAGTIQITGASAAFICNTNTSDGHFSIPPFVLLSLPPSGTSTYDLTLSATSTAAFTASGISAGTINSNVIVEKRVIYQ